MKHTADHPGYCLLLHCSRSSWNDCEVAGEVVGFVIAAEAAAFKQQALSFGNEENSLYFQRDWRSW